MGFTLNIDRTRNELRRVVRELPHDTRVEVRAVMISVFNETKFLVPKATGALERSGSLDEPTPFRWVIKYGNSEVDDIDVSYAAAVHNQAKERHAPPTQMEYVSVPLEMSIDHHRAAVIRAVKRAMS